MFDEKFSLELLNKDRLQKFSFLNLSHIHRGLSYYPFIYSYVDESPFIEFDKLQTLFHLLRIDNTSSF